MRFQENTTGRSLFRKARKRFDEPGQARELTFSCYKGFQFLNRDRTRQWFIDSLEEARKDFQFDLWAYVIMPEHVHLLIFPKDEVASAGAIAGKIKEQVARKAIKFLKENAPNWLELISVQEGSRLRHRFWQPGGGYDRNVIELSTVSKMIDYIHMNPVRRGLVARPEDWPWSSARWYAGMEPVLIEMDRTIPGQDIVGSKLV
ncbi:MAG: REP-associated tyrosine transposase [Planctomycetota bacterium]|jgi:putative transposase